MSPPKRAATLALAWTLAFAAGPASAADPASTAGTVLRLFPAIVVDDEAGAGAGAGAADAAAFGEALRSALSTSLEREGFSVLPVTLSAPLPTADPVEMANAARAVGASWAALARLYFGKTRLSCEVLVYEAVEGALVAAESFSAYAGLGALPLMELRAKRAAAKAAAYREASAQGGSAPSRRPLPYRIALRSRDEGAAISLGDPGTGMPEVIGRIEGGELLLPYLALEIGSRVAVAVAAPGKRSAASIAVLGEAARVISLPPLERIERHSLYVDTGPGRLLGLGLGYRFFIKPDWAFAFVDARAFSGYSFLPGASPVFHTEIWQGLGTYIAIPPGSLIRAGVGCGAGILFSSSAAVGEGDRVLVDFALIPIEAFAEYRLAAGMSARLSLRSAYSLGLDSGIAARGWMGSYYPILASAGLKWSL